MADDEILYHINPIKIMMRLNRKGKKEFTPFTFSMLSHPDLVGMDDSYTYPYFTSSVTYPYSILANRDYRYVVEFFFDRNRFEKVLRKYADGYVDENDLYNDPKIMNEVFQSKSELDTKTNEIIDQLDYNIEYNIDCMLKLLFPINYSFDNVYTNTFRHRVYGEFNNNIFYFDFKRPFWGGNTAVLKIDGTEMVVSGVEWLNDVLNHPVYFNFIKAYYTGLTKRKTLSRVVTAQLQTKYNEYGNLLFTLYNNPPKYKDSLPDPSKYDSVLLSGKITNIIPVNATEITENQISSHFFTDLLVELLIMHDNLGKTQSYSQSISLRNSILQELINTINPFAQDGEIVQFMRSSKIVKNDKYSREMFIAHLAEAKPLFLRLANILIQFYIELNEYNAKAEYKISLKQQFTTQLSKLYELSIALKASELVDDFMNLRIRKLDLEQKSNRSKEETDIISAINKDYPQFANMSNQISNTLGDVTKPTRETSNLLLRNEINKIRLPPPLKEAEKNADKQCYANTDFFRDVYRKYLHPNKKQFQHTSPFEIMLMYTGVNTVGGDTGSTNAAAKEVTNEIYVLIDVIDKKKYDTKKHRCDLKDNTLVNQLNNLTSSTDDSLVNTFRDYDLYEKTFEKEGTTTQSNAPPPPPAKVGGRTRRYKRRLTKIRRTRRK